MRRAFLYHTKRHFGGGVNTVESVAFERAQCFDAQAQQTQFF